MIVLATSQLPTVHRKMRNEVAPWMLNAAWRIKSATSADFHWVKVYVQEWLPYRAKEHKRFASYLELVRLEDELEEKIKQIRRYCSEQICEINRQRQIYGRSSDWTREKTREWRRDELSAFLKKVRVIVARRSEHEASLKQSYAEKMAQVSLA